MFEKTKKFIKDHEKAITLVAVTTGTLVGCGLGYRFGRTHIGRVFKNNPAMQNIMRVFDGIPEGCKIRVFGSITNPGLAPDKLGELGKMMVEEGADELGDAFTHFIAIKKL
jgi:hypothetical protein